MRCSKIHKEVDESGVGRCSTPMWCNGCPAGFCDEPALGVQEECETFWNESVNEMCRMDGRYNGYVPYLACPSHAGPRYRVSMDGNQYCAVFPNFINLQESIAGFGDTKELAVAALVKERGTE